MLLNSCIQVVQLFLMLLYLVLELLIIRLIDLLLLEKCCETHGMLLLLRSYCFNLIPHVQLILHLFLNLVLQIINLC